MSKMGFDFPFEYLKQKLWPKEGLGVKVSIWLSTIKSRKLPWFICMKVACHISLERSWQRLQLLLIKDLHKKLWASEIMGVTISRISRLSTWESRNKMTFGCKPMVMYIKYYKEEGGGFSQVWVVVNLVSSCRLVICSCTKSVPTTH